MRNVKLIFKYVLDAAVTVEWQLLIRSNGFVYFQRSGDRRYSLLRDGRMIIGLLSPT